MTKIETLVKLIDQSSINCHGIFCRECPFDGLPGGRSRCALLNLDLDGADVEGNIKNAIFDAVDEAREEDCIPKKGDTYRGLYGTENVTILDTDRVIDGKRLVRFETGTLVCSSSVDDFLSVYKKVEEPPKPESKHSHTTPDHYRLNPEPIDVIKGWNLGFCLGNVAKYIARAGHKAGESRDKDLHKAMEYLRMELEDQADAKESTAARRCC